MSTRCQVQVVVEGGTYMDTSKITLYHHFDGYPTAMLPMFIKAYEVASPGAHGNAGKVASFLCSVDPGEFEPEERHTLHGDIDWYYRLFPNSWCCGKAKWEIEVYRVFYVDGVQKRYLVLPRLDLLEANERRLDIEEAGDSGVMLEPRKGAGVNDRDHR